MKLLKPEIDIIKHWKRDIFQPIVSISCITFNHEKYIRDALEGFIMQRTTFPFVIVILDDASTDGNPEIIREYEKKYPKLFRCFLLKENTWGKPNRREIIKPYLDAREEGKYIALCEGDDYWTDPYKLQKQVDFLEANEGYSLCFHRFFIIDEESKSLSPFIRKQSSTIVDFAQMRIPIQPLTTMFRNELKPIIPADYILRMTGANFLFLRLAEIGKFKYMKDPMAVYRIHSGGIWSGKNRLEKEKMAIDNIVCMIDYINHRKSIRKILISQYFKKVLITMLYSIYQKDVYSIKIMIKKIFKIQYWGYLLLD